MILKIPTFYNIECFSMEKYSKPSKVAKFPSPKSSEVFSEVFYDFIRHAQQTSGAASGTTLDPEQLQVGQPIYDQTGAEYVVVENVKDDPTSVLMPKDQQGTQVPQGVKTVEDVDLASNYNLQNPSTPPSKSAGYADLGRGVGIDDREFDDSTEPTSWSRMSPGEVLMEDWDTPDIKQKPRRIPIGDPAQKIKNGAILADIEGFDSINKNLNDEEAGFRIGESGFVDIMNSIRDMVDCGYSIVDVILNIGELYPRGIGERALEEARKKGIL